MRAQTPVALQLLERLPPFFADPLEAPVELEGLLVVGIREAPDRPADFKGVDYAVDERPHHNKSLSANKINMVWKQAVNYLFALELLLPHLWLAWMIYAQATHTALFKAVLTYVVGFWALVALIAAVAYATKGMQANQAPQGAQK